MIKILPLHEITLKLPDGTTLKTSFKDLTKKENASVVEKSNTLKKESAKLSKNINRLKRKIEIAEKMENWAKVEKLEDKLDIDVDKLSEYTESVDDNNILEDLFKTKLELSLIGKDRDKILEEADAIGYQYMYTTIATNVAEEIAKN